MVIRLALMSALIGCSCLTATDAHASASAPTSQALRVIAGNADAAGSNAHIYQWKRVNLEVERIAAEEHALETSGADDPSLRAAILALRSAQQAHDVQRTETDAAKVIDLCQAAK